MNNFAKKFKRKRLKRIAEIKNAVNTLIRPFKERPSVNIPVEEGAGRINAHDLFSHYTADIIKEDVIFVR